MVIRAKRVSICCIQKKKLCVCSTNFVFSVGYVICTRYVCTTLYDTRYVLCTRYVWYQVRIMYQIRMYHTCRCTIIFVSGWWYAWYLRSAQETAVSLLRSNCLFVNGWWYHTNVPPVDAHVWRHLYLSAVARCSDSYCIFSFVFLERIRGSYLCKNNMKQKGIFDFKKNDIKEME